MQASARAASLVHLLLASALLSSFVASAYRQSVVPDSSWAERAYIPMRLHPQLFDTEAGWRDEWFDPAFLLAAAELRAGNSSAFAELARRETDGVYSFPLFTPLFAEMMLEEVDNYKKTDLPVNRPNSMNNYGLIVNDIGMRAMLSRLQAETLLPIAQLLYPDEGREFTDHHSFMVQYKAHEDPGLDMHTDDSDVTFNVCLGRTFTGAGLTFCGTIGRPDHRIFDMAYQHELGRCVVHLGSKRHGADDISAGERQNLIIWNRNQPFRDAGGTRAKYGYYKEGSVPDTRCLSWTHDRDYANLKAFPKGLRGQQAREVNGRKAWCPHAGACYDGMDKVFSQGVFSEQGDLR